MILLSFRCFLSPLFPLRAPARASPPQCGSFHWVLTSGQAFPLSPLPSAGWCYLCKTCQQFIDLCLYTFHRWSYWVFNGVFMFLLEKLRNKFNSSVALKDLLSYLDSLLKSMISLLASSSFSSSVMPSIGSGCSASTRPVTGLMRSLTCRYSSVSESESLEYWTSELEVLHLWPPSSPLVASRPAALP